MRFETARISRIGGRENNEDFADFVVLKRKEVGCWVVADGLGGHRGGEIASRIAVETIIKTFKKDPQCTPEAISHYLNTANKEILIYQQENPRFSRMRTTVALLLSDFRQILWAHVGDTRFYHFHKGKVKFQTLDHSVSQARVAEGEITPQQLRYHEDRNHLLKTMGQKGTFRPLIRQEFLKLKKDDAFLLCTDGFWENVEENEMEIDYANSQIPRKWLLSMEKRILKKTGGENDNYTAIGIYFSPGLKK